jgi:hypothetical protein
MQSVTVLPRHSLSSRLQIFDEVEKRRQKSMAMIYPFMQKLRESPFPAPGNSVEIKSHIPESGTEVRLSYGSMSTQRKRVYGPLTSLWTLLASTPRAGRAPSRDM